MNQYEPSKKFKNITLVLAGLAIAVVLGGFWVVFSKILKIKEEAGKTQALTGSVEEAYRIKGQLNELDLKIKSLDSFFVSQDEEVSFLEKIESLASSDKVKLEIRSISVDASKKSQDFKDNLNFQLEAQGSREGVLAFFEAFEKLPKALTVSSAELTQAGSAWSLKVSASVARLR